jgi:hypothetical protein
MEGKARGAAKGSIAAMLAQQVLAEQEAGDTRADAARVPKPGQHEGAAESKGRGAGAKGEPRPRHDAAPQQHSGMEASHRQQRSRRRREDRVEWQGAPLVEERGEERETGERAAVGDGSAWPRARPPDQDGDGSWAKHGLKQGLLEERVQALAKENEFLKRERCAGSVGARAAAGRGLSALAPSCPPAASRLGALLPACCLAPISPKLMRCHSRMVAHVSTAPEGRSTCEGTQG